MTAGITLTVLSLLAADARFVGNVKRDASGSMRPISHGVALRQQQRSRRGKRIVPGLLFDASAPGCDFEQWPHVVRRPSKQKQGDAYVGRAFDFDAESSRNPGTFVRIAVRYPRGSSPATDRAGREACSMLTQVRWRLEAARTRARHAAASRCRPRPHRSTPAAPLDAGLD